ncbi:MAG: hypothetical protein E7637_06070 [Ruminococcaceae bacterium]|nr:hypothetical protein [Oscillospiraceae bacterium]
MTREDPRELLHPERARAMLKKSWRELAFTRLLILFFVFLLCFLPTHALSLIYPALQWLPVSVAVVSALLLCLTLYYVISEYLLIQKGAFEIREDRVRRVAENDSKRKGVWVHTIFRIYSFLQYLVLRDPSVRFAEYVFDFCEYGKVAATKKQVDRAAEGDTFYLIVYKDQKRTVRKMLSANTYRIK